VPVALVVNPKNIDAKDLAGFLALARKSPGTINIGSSGLGTIPHLAIELLQQRNRHKTHPRAYRGGGQALQDMLAGQIDATFAPLSNRGVLRSVRPPARARGGDGQTRGDLPDVPTFAEAGVPDFEVSNLGTACSRPRRRPTDRSMSARRHPGGAGREDIKRIWAEQGARVDLESRRPLPIFVRHEVERWSGIAKAVNIPMD